MENLRKFWIKRSRNSVKRLDFKEKLAKATKWRDVLSSRWVKVLNYHFGVTSLYLCALLIAAITPLFKILSQSILYGPSLLVAVSLVLVTFTLVLTYFQIEQKKLALIKECVLTGDEKDLFSKTLESCAALAPPGDFNMLREIKDDAAGYIPSYLRNLQKELDLYRSHWEQIKRSGSPESHLIVGCPFSDDSPDGYENLLIYEEPKEENKGHVLLPPPPREWRM